MTEDRSPAPVETAWARAVGDHLVQVHAELRRELGAIREGTGAFLEGRGERPVPNLGAHLRTHCLAFCDALGQHHDNEESAFPRIEKHAPDLAPVLDRLHREHKAVNRMKHDLQTLLDDLGSHDPEQVNAELDRLTAELEAHFAYEEEALIPALNTMSLSTLAPPAPEAGDG